jgi:hypothetical protein
MIRDRPRSARQPSHARTATALLLAGLATGGCSFALVRPAPAPVDWPYPVTEHSSQQKCTSSLAPPNADLGAALGLGGLAFAYAARNGADQDPTTRWFTPIVGASALPFIASAVYGYFQIGRCRSYQHHFTNQK